MDKYINADKMLKEYEHGVYDTTDLAEMLYYMPAADVVEVKHGHWKPFDLTWGRSIYACTFCGEAFEVPTEWGNPMYRFCPFCGARMNLEDEEEE